VLGRRNNKLSVFLQMEHISKRFGNFYANRDISLTVNKGEVLTLLGENGAGKSTLMNILIGLYQPTEGKIFINGNEVKIDSPSQAVKQGIGMVHQHFMLVEAMTVFENIILGDKNSKGIFIDKAARKKEILELSNRYGLNVQLDAFVKDISVGEQQRVEILKALYHGAKLLILDEPTATLTDIETEGLFKIIESLINEDKSVIFISHKMREVLRISTRIAILRLGELVGTLDIDGADGQSLANLMIGKELHETKYDKKISEGDEVLKLSHVKYHPNMKHNGLNDVSMTIKRGEIVGIAGVDGNGQTQLAQMVTGVIAPEEGDIYVDNSKVGRYDPEYFILHGIAHVPEDRNLQGLIGDMSIADNLVLKDIESERFSKGKGALLKKKAIIDYGESLAGKYDIRCTSVEQDVRSLSGGNQQKVILARELESSPEVLVVVHPTRGLDIGATNFVHERIIEARDNGVGIILISADLDEILKMSDRILVMFEGQIIGEFSGNNPSVEKISMAMTGNNEVNNNE